MSNSGPGLASSLLPGTPTGGRLCLYTTAKKPDSVRLKQVSLNQKEAVDLANTVDGVNLYTAGQGPDCPANIGGSTAILVFQIPGRSAIDLWYTEGGCATLDNGVIVATVEGNPGFYNQFDSAMAHYGAA